MGYNPGPQLSQSSSMRDTQHSCNATLGAHRHPPASAPTTPTEHTIRPSPGRLHLGLVLLVTAAVRRPLTAPHRLARVHRVERVVLLLLQMRIASSARLHLARWVGRGCFYCRCWQMQGVRLARARALFQLVGLDLPVHLRAQT